MRRVYQSEDNGVRKKSCVGGIAQPGRTQQCPLDMLKRDGLIKKEDGHINASLKCSGRGRCSIWLVRRPESVDVWGWHVRRIRLHIGNRHHPRRR